MNSNNFSDEKLEKMIKAASNGTGISAEELKKRLDDGNLKGLRNVDSDKLNRILSDPAAVEKIMSSPAAQALLKKFGKL